VLTPFAIEKWGIFRIREFAVSIILAMNRSDLVLQMAQSFTHLTLEDVELAVNAILDAMNDALTRGHRIEIRGFGSFKVVHRASRVGRNPRTGESVHVPPKRATQFKTGKSFRSALEVKAEQP
jgi:integration host factor subunit beta